MITKTTIAKAGTQSIKNTVPERIVEFLELEDKNELQKNMNIQNNNIIVIIKKSYKNG